MIELLQSVFAAFIGGGLVWAFTLKSTVKTKKAEAKTAEATGRTAEVEALENSVKTLRKEMEQLHIQLNSYRKVFVEMCESCMYKDFFHRRENEVNTKINNK